MRCIECNEPLEVVSIDAKYTFCPECQIKEDNRQTYLAMEREGEELMREALEGLEVPDTTPQSGRHIERTVRMVHYPNVIGSCVCTLMYDADGEYIKGWDELYLSLEPHPDREGEFYAKAPSRGRLA